MSVTVAVLAPEAAGAAAGEKETVNVQLAPAATALGNGEQEVPPVLAKMKSVALAPARTIVAMFNVSVPVLETVNVCAALVVPLS